MTTPPDTATDLDRLLALCKCGIHIEVNGHRDMYQSVREFLYNITQQDEDHIDAETLAAMEAADTIVNVHVYPDTPIGFYDIYGTDINDVIRQAIEAIEGDRP